MSAPTIPQLSPLSVGVTHTFMQRKAAELARDIVLELDSPDNLATAYGLNGTQWQVLKLWPSFIRLITDSREELAGPAGVQERARRRAQLAVAEYAVLDMAGIMGNDKMSARDRIAAANVLVDIGGMSAKVAAASTAGAGTAAVFGGPLIQIITPDGAQISIAQQQQNPIDAIADKARIVSEQ